MRSDIISSASDIITWAEQTAPAAMPAPRDYEASTPEPPSVTFTPIRREDVPLAWPWQAPRGLSFPPTHPPPQPWCQWHPQPWRWDRGGGQGARQGPPRGKSLGSTLTETGRHHNPVAQPGHLRTALYCFRQLASGEQWQTVMAYERKKVDKKQESVKERKSIVSALFW